MLKTIPNFPDYTISEIGCICSRRRERAKGGLLHQYLGNHGYLTVMLWANKKSHTKCVHRLVLEAFVGPCPEGMEACHNNGNRTDNRLENLRWDTRSGNHFDKREHGTMLCGSKQPNAKISEGDARMIIYTSRTNLFTQREIARQYGISEGICSEIIHRKRWGHIWAA